MSREIKLIDEILFIIVLYKTDLKESPAYQALLKLSETIPCRPFLFLYDNSPEPLALTPDASFIYRHNPANAGVSTAYNEGAVVAERANKKWLLLLDQDTKFNIDFIRALPAAMEQHQTSVAFVPILNDVKGRTSPFRWLLARGTRTFQLRDKLALKRYRFLNSGLLIKREAFVKAGGYVESIPLYFSDIAFGKKLLAVTDHFIVIPVVMEHAMSATEKIHYNSAIQRYGYFCIGSREMGKTFGAAALYHCQAFLRGINLSFRYRNSTFLKIFFELNFKL